LLIVLGGLGISSCAVLEGKKPQKLSVHALEDDFFSVETGTSVGDRVVSKDGYFISEYYFQEVMEASVEEVT